MSFGSHSDIEPMSECKPKGFFQTKLSVLFSTRFKPYCKSNWCLLIYIAFNQVSYFSNKYAHLASIRPLVKLPTLLDFKRQSGLNSKLSANLSKSHCILGEKNSRELIIWLQLKNTQFYHEISLERLTFLNTSNKQVSSLKSELSR